MMAIIRHLIMVALIAFLAWGCLDIIGRHYGLGLPLFHPYLRLAVYRFAPQALAVLALIAWAQARQWRRLEEMREAPIGGASQALARGAFRVRMAAPNGPGALEVCALRLLLLALLAHPYQLEASQPGWWAFGIIAGWWMLRRVG